MKSGMSSFPNVRIAMQYATDRTTSGRRMTMTDETLEKYREMRDDIVLEFDEVIARLDELKAAGKFKTVTYKQLFARKMTLSAMLLDFAIRELGVTHVDVNEQNTQARGFYEHKGFEVIGRSETDEQGEPFPILHMRLKAR